MSEEVELGDAVIWKQGDATEGTRTPGREGRAKERSEKSRERSTRYARGEAERAMATNSSAAGCTTVSHNDLWFVGVFLDAIATLAGTGGKQLLRDDRLEVQ